MAIRCNPLDYYEAGDWQTMLREAEKHETPFLVVNLDTIKRNYLKMKKCFPGTTIYYAVKANPALPVLELLRDLGSCFDVASTYEMDRLLGIGVSPERISYGNIVKKVAHIEYAYEKGIRLFVSDSEADLRNIAIAAPKSRIFIRISAEGADTADWPLSRKFGCHPDLAIDLLLLAQKLGLTSCGVSFHVGSQQRDIGVWDSTIAKVRYIFNYMREEGMPLTLINMGGGLPARYINKTCEMDTYAQEITRYLQEDFPEEFAEKKPLEIIMEPGRSLVGGAGVLATEVVLISQKSRVGVDRWVYLDTGIFNGLIETLNENIKYPLYCESPGPLNENFVIAGPTCDSQDIMYEFFRNPLPQNITIGSRVYWLTSGAYTASYCSVGFNGFPPIETYFVSNPKPDSLEAENFNG
ncbi:MAG: type III PLP-dependent enzyme [Puniceicoccales bacterium]|jgi:ornithine decarboxylase|nr:type III PLP-dependent enzyme [Puniceicoccales bacterium]